MPPDIDHPQDIDHERSAVSYSVTLSEMDGLPVARKSVLDGATTGASRLDQEAATLASVHHPGVVRLVQWDGETLTTEFAGQPVRQIVTVPTTLAAGIASTLAHTAADLHEAGLTHGAIEPSHVLIGHGTTPRLCSFGSVAHATVELEAEDVAGVGLVLRHLVGDVGDGDPIPERRSPFRHGRGQQFERRALLTIADQATADAPSHRPTARRLAQLIADTVPSTPANHLDAGSIGIPSHLGNAPQTKPSDDDLADIDPAPPVALPFPHPALGGLVVPDSPADLFDLPAAPAPSTPDAPSSPAANPPLFATPLRSDDPPMTALADEPPWPGGEPAPAAPVATTPHHHRSLRPMVAGLVGLLGVALIGAGVIGLLRGGDREIANAAAPAATTSTRPTSPQPPRPDADSTHDASSTTTSAPVVPACGPAGSPDLDGDGCTDELRVDGTVVRVGDVRFQIGRAGDVVTLGDWDCDGIITPALLRPATGEVFVFAEWTESEVAVQPVERVMAATRIYPDADALGCDQLVVEDTEGRRTAIDAR